MAMEVDFEVEESAQERGMKWFGRVLAVIIILLVSGLGDMMYIQLMSAKFPAGFGLVICYAGALTGFMCVIYMLIGKSALFSPGPQMVVAWLVFGIELMLTALNLILVFQGPAQGGLLAVWAQFAPATPVVNMAGVAILFFLDESQKMKHEDVEAALDNKRAQRRYMKSMAKARLRLQNKQLAYLVTELDAAACSPESLLGIRQTAQELNATLLGQLSGGRTYRAQSALPAPAQPAQLPAPGNGYTPAPGARVLESDATPAQQPVRSARSAQPAKKSILGRAKDAVVGAFIGGEPEPATLAQTGELPASPAQYAPVPSEKTSNQIYREEQRAAQSAPVPEKKATRQVVASPHVAEVRRARRAARYQRGGWVVNHPVAPVQQFAEPSPAEHAAPVAQDDGPKNAPEAAQEPVVNTRTRKSGASTRRTKKQA